MSTRETSLTFPSRSSVAPNARAARMGPTVCELEGPIPILNNSKKLVFTSHPRGAIHALRFSHYDAKNAKSLEPVRRPTVCVYTSCRRKSCCHFEIFGPDTFELFRIRVQGLVGAYNEHRHEQGRFVSLYHDASLRRLQQVFDFRADRRRQP